MAPSFISAPISFDDVEDKTYGPKGLYDLRVKDIKDRTADGKGYCVIVEFTKGPKDVNVENLNAIMHNLSDISQETDAEKAKTKMLFIKKLYHLFKVPLAGNSYDPMALLGKTAKDAMVDIQEYPKGSGQKSNILVLPALPQKKK
jgi:hypothetical protein